MVRQSLFSHIAFLLKDVITAYKEIASDLETEINARKKEKDSAWKEQQPWKQFELYSRFRGYREKLENLKSGKNTPQRETN